jgi:hypothetical protein
MIQKQEEETMISEEAFRAELRRVLKFLGHLLAHPEKIDQVPKVVTPEDMERIERP